MKAVLAAVNAKYIHSNLAVYCLKAYAKQQGEEVTLREYTINQNPEEILKGLYQEQPDFLALSCYIWNISMVKEIAVELHKILPDLPIWVGGPEVSYDAGRFLMENTWASGVMRGEGEQTFTELLQMMQGEKSREEIRGISFRKTDGEICHNPDRPTMDLSKVPFPYEDMTVFENRIIYYESSRGCPFSCSYCLSSIDKRLRFRDLSLVLQELQFFLDKKVPQVKFVDRTFNCSHAHAKAIWKYLIAHDNGVTNFHFEVAADLLDEEEIALIGTMRPGLIQLEIGVQSTNPQTIEEIHRKMDFARVSDVVTRIRSVHNIHQHLDLIAGAFRRQSVLSLPEMSRPSAPSAVIAALPTAKSCRSMMSSTCAPASIAHAAAASLSFPAQSICPGQSAPHTSVIRWVSAANGAYRKPPFSAGHGRITQSAPYVQP